MTFTNVKSSTDPGVAIDAIPGFGDVVLVKLMNPEENSTDAAPHDAADGLWVVARNTEGPITVDTPVDVGRRPILVGMKASAVPLANVSANNDAQWIWGDLDGSVNVTARTDPNLVEATSGTATGGATYAAGEVIGTLLTFPQAALAAGRGGTLTGARVIDNSGTTTPVDLRLMLFNNSPAGVPPDSNAFSGMTAAQKIAAKPLPGTIRFDAGNWDQQLCQGTLMNGAGIQMDYLTGTTNLYGVLYYGATVKAAPTGSYWVGLDVVRN
jgi:hypothetical protein